ncbi:hypothetical protein LTR66_003086 [Elasticomyces elasticus]|nr:hypothetical protein LTR66_003086 [Elasticomyces elasticus]
MSQVPRPRFDPVDISVASAPAIPLVEVESPSLSSSNALARFEFEPGRSKDGTKVLMVEWEDDETTKNMKGDWHVSWEGKRTVLPARDAERTSDVGSYGINRLYFLLPGGERVPPTVTLKHIPAGPVASREPVVWRTNPLPAIFPPELGLSARQAGKKGVLHTIWAKKRLQVLQKEIDHESRHNIEGIGLQMAISEREWIEHNFGVSAKPASVGLPSQSAIGTAMASPTSPRSPGGGRLMEKLKGLKLGTSERELGAGRKGSGGAEDAQGGGSATGQNPLSPESCDIAVSSFGSFAARKGMPDAATLAAKPAQPPSAARRMAPQRPPEALLAQQRQNGMSSLNAFADRAGGRDVGGPYAEEKEDDLFALPMSPRSPDMAKSPFSFGKSDTARHLHREKA